MFICTKRSAEIAEIFAEEFGKESINETVYPILAWQFGWDPGWFFPNMLDYVNKNWRNPNEIFYAIAVAPYFSECEPDKAANVDTVLNTMADSSAESVKVRKDVIRVADKFKLQGGAMCYEGGPSCTAQTDTNLSVRIEANLSEKIEEIIYRDITDNWQDLGGELFVYYSLSGTTSRFGCWGAVQTLEDLNTPKYRALLRISQRL